MHFSNNALMAMCLLVIPNTRAAPAPGSEIAEPDYKPDLISRTAKSGTSCVGDSNHQGRTCIYATWTSKTKISVKMTVENPKGHDVYGKYRVYWAGDNQPQDSKHLRGTKGAIEKATKEWQIPMVGITGVRAYSCEDNVGSDNCARGEFMEFGDSKP